jgi:hypothetical protein
MAARQRDASLGNLDVAALVEHVTAFDVAHDHVGVDVIVSTAVGAPFTCVPRTVQQRVSCCWAQV